MQRLSYLNSSLLFATIASLTLPLPCRAQVAASPTENVSTRVNAADRQVREAGIAITDESGHSGLYEVITNAVSLSTRNSLRFKIEANAAMPRLGVEVRTLESRTENEARVALAIWDEGFSTRFAMTTVAVNGDSSAEQAQLQLEQAANAMARQVALHFPTHAAQNWTHWFIPNAMAADLGQVMLDYFNATMRIALGMAFLYASYRFALRMKECGHGELSVPTVLGVGIPLFGFVGLTLVGSGVFKFLQAGEE